MRYKENQYFCKIVFVHLEFNLFKDMKNSFLLFVVYLSLRKRERVCVCLTPFRCDFMVYKYRYVTCDQICEMVGLHKHPQVICVSVCVCVCVRLGDMTRVSVC